MLSRTGASVGNRKPGAATRAPQVAHRLTGRGFAARASGLASGVRRPYELCHACASLMLNAGVPATEAARRLGHSVAMLLKRYANCIDGQERAANERIERALGDDGV